MTAREKQAYFFQEYLNNGGAEELAAFHIGGEFETTNITFSFAKETPAKEALFGLIKYGSTKVAGFGLTTFGVRGEPVSSYDVGRKASEPRTTLDNINFNIYLSPENARNHEYTARHEMQHVRYISGQFLKGKTIQSGGYQHRNIFSRPNQIPTIQQLIQMKRN